MSLASEMQKVIEIRLDRDRETIRKFPWWTGLNQRDTEQVLKRDVELFMSRPEFCSSQLSELSEAGRNFFADTVANSTAHLVRLQLEVAIENAIRSRKIRIIALLRNITTGTITWLCATLCGGVVYASLIGHGPHRHAPQVLEHPSFGVLLLAVPFIVKRIIRSSLPNRLIVFFFIGIVTITIWQMWQRQQ